jgi:catechol 2,3-dioxygenase-like lactoylglutathione lyase family enzyme
MELRVVRNTDRFDDACAFYSDVLGWPVTTQWGDHGRGRIFGYGDVGRIELIETPAGTASVPVSGVEVSVEVDDIQALYDSVSASGHRPLGAPADQPWGHRSFTVHDPAGLSVTFFQCI